MTTDVAKIPKQPEPEILDDLYDRLGVPRTATNDQIKRAYRTLSAYYHADNKATANAVMYASIQEAWDVLGSSEARAKYDDEGIATPPPVGDPIEREAREQCAMVLNKIIDVEEDPDHEPILDKVQGVFANQRQTFVDRRKDIDRIERRIKSVRKRLKRKKGSSKNRSPFLIMMLDHRVKTIITMREKLAHDEAVFDRLMEIFGEYMYEVSPRETFDQFQSGLYRPGRGIFTTGL